LEEDRLGWVKLVCQQFIWVLCFDAPAVEFVGRKVFEIEGDDEIRARIQRLVEKTLR
jgi:hypothetical protein